MNSLTAYNRSIYRSCKNEHHQSHWEEQTPDRGFVFALPEYGEDRDPAQCEKDTWRILYMTTALCHGKADGAPYAKVSKKRARNSALSRGIPMELPT